MKVLGDRFEIVAPLGSMGEVYRAHDRAREEDVALKLLPALDATALLRFKTEFRTLHDVEHENLVRVHELHEAHGTWFFTMQLIDGIDALTWIGRDEQRLRLVLCQLARVVHRLHGEGLVHRDITASNVLVTRAGLTKLLDFGLVAPAWAHGDGDGTPSYMAPEQIDGDVDTAADWYAVGVLAFHALTGRFPFVGAPDAVLSAKRTATAPQVRTLVPEAPADLARLTDSLLANRPKDRPRGDAIVAALGGACEPVRVARHLLIGRDRELALLDRAVGEMTGTVAVVGDSGIGKTALLRAFAQDVEARGVAWVLGGRCWERESVPYKGFDGVIDELVARLEVSGPTIGSTLSAGPWATILAQAFPALRRLEAFAGQPAFGELTGHETVARVFRAVRWLFGEVAREQQLVIVVDDLQWADQDTVALVRGLVDSTLANVLIVVGARDAGALPDRAQTIELAPLSPAETTMLVDVVARDLGGTIEAAVIARQAAGHPLLATELTRHAVTTGASGPIAFERAVCQLADRAGVEARRLATIVSLATAPLAPAAAARAAELAPAAFYDALAALRQVQLVATTGVAGEASIEVSHERIRRALTADLDERSRTPLHARIATALIEAAASPAVIAHHFELAGERETAAIHAVRAAETAETALAFHQAARLYAWALDLAPLREELRVRHGECLAQAGLGAKAATVFLACAEIATGAERIDLRRRAMQQFLLMGHHVRALALLDELMAELALPNPQTQRAMIAGTVRRRFAIRMHRAKLPTGTTSAQPLERARLDVAWDASVGLAMLDPLRAFYMHSLDLSMCQRAGDSSRLARALMAEAPYLAAAGRRTRRVEHLLELADQASKRAGFPAIIPLARGTIAFFCGDWATCRDELERCEQLLAQDRPRLVREGFGPAQLNDVTLRFRHVANMYLGQLAELRRTVPDLLQDAVDQHNVAAATHLRSGVLAYVHLAAGDVDTAIRNAEEAIAPWQDARTGVPHFMDIQARTLVDLYRGDATAAHERVCAGWIRLSRAHMLRVSYVRVTLLDLRGRAAVAAAATASERERRRYDADARWCANQLARAPGRWPQALRDVIVAGIARLRGEDPSAALLRAAKAFEAQHMILHAAAAELALGGVHAGRAIADTGVVDVVRFVRLLVPT